MNGSTGAQPIALAATLILMRESAGAQPEVLMLERASSMAFAAGALVFPGGRIDPGDFALAERLARPDPVEREEIAARIAGIRETIEEAGIAIGLTPRPDAALLAAIRNELSEGRDFGQLLDEAGMTLDLDDLTPFARWRPPSNTPHRFDTRFFLARAPEDAVEAADGGESVRALWSSARMLLDDAGAGRHRVVFPTWCTLDRLAQFASLAEARADAALHAHHIASGRVEHRDGIEWICIDEGIGYPTTAMLLSKAMRD